MLSHRRSGVCGRRVPDVAVEGLPNINDGGSYPKVRVKSFFPPTKSLVQLSIDSIRRRLVHRFSLYIDKHAT